MVLSRYGSFVFGDDRIGVVGRMRVDVLNGFLYRFDSFDGNGRVEEFSVVVGGGGGCDKFVGFGDIGVL